MDVRCSSLSHPPKCPSNSPLSKPASSAACWKRNGSPRRTTPSPSTASPRPATKAQTATPSSRMMKKSVEAGLNALREKKLASVIFGAGSRVQKYRHKLLEHYDLTPAEVALLCVLLLRGPQTPGELRSRTERMHAFETMADLETRLDELARGDAPLIRFLPARPGRKSARVIQLLSAEVPRAGDPGRRHCLPDVPVLPARCRAHPVPKRRPGCRDRRPSRRAGATPRGVPGVSGAVLIRSGAVPGVATSLHRGSKLQLR
ncbi:MAG: DUF480 domain-containing protein [Chthoniobacter sp.]